MNLDLIRNYLSKWGRSTGQNVLPTVCDPDLLEKIKRGKAVELKSTIKTLPLSPSSEFSASIGAMVRSCRECGWTDAEILKLEIYADYFSNNIGSAYEKIVKNGFIESDFDLYVLACIALYLNDNFEDAYRLLKCRNLSDPGFDANHDFLSFAGYIVLASGNSMTEAVKYLDFSYQKGLSSPAFITNGYSIYFEAGCLEKAAKLRQLANENYREENPEINYSLSGVELAREYYPEGFRLAESRYKHPEVGNYINKNLLSRPLWQGEPLVGKTLLVHSEQGLGDTIMCARFLPYLLKLEGKIIWECQAEVITLLEHAYPDVIFLQIKKEAAPEVRFDYWVGSMSLPHWLNITKDTVPCTAGYLSVPNDHASYWHQKVSALSAGACLRVGIAWSGNPRHRADRRRSISFMLLKPYLEKAQDINFFTLQTSVSCELPCNVIDVSEELITLADTAGLINEMDIVLTVDTSVVHLAGSLGKETFLLFPYRYDWRWGLQGESNNWYDTVRVIRQNDHGDWRGVLDDVFNTRLPDCFRLRGR